MTRTETRPFAEEDLPAAGRLLAERHRRHRRDEPRLSPAYEDPGSAEAAVTEAWKADGASGAVATTGGGVVGFVLGAPKSSEVWGQNVWVGSAGMAAEDAEVMRALYAEAAARWVEEGRTAHYALVPADDRVLLSAWFRLAFGHQHTHAIQGLEGATTAPARPSTVTVRRPTRDDIPVLARLDLELSRHQGLSPTFSAGPSSSYEEAVAEWEEDFDDPAFATFVAEHDGSVVGSAVGTALEKSSSHTGPARPDRAALLGFAAVLPEARGLGAGRALGEAVHAWARDDGRFSSIVTDWRETNLQSSRTWRALGYRETFVRVHRLIGH